MDDILYLLIFLFLLVVFPMMGFFVSFFVIRRVFAIFRFIPYVIREIVIPHWQKDMESAADEDNGTVLGEDGFRYKKTVLTPDELKILQDSFLTRQINVDPRKFAKKNKKKLAIVGITLGSIILAVILYKIFWVVYDFLVLTYF